MIKIHYDEKDLNVKGFYMEGVSPEIPSPNIVISDSLNDYLLTLGTFRIKNKPDPGKKVYNINDTDLFEKVDTTVISTDKSEVEVLKDQNAQLFLDNMEKEMRISDLEEKVNTLLQGGK